MYEKFIQAFAWNSISVFLYKIILLAHQIVLFHFVSPEIYGTSGMIFAAIYLLIGITGFGFEYTLFSFFSTYKKSKKQFRQLANQYIDRFWQIVIVAFIWYMILQSNSNNHLVLFFTKNISFDLLPYVLLIFVAESFKKSLEALAQLSFLNKTNSFIQVSMITLYVALVWIGYGIQGIINLHTIFIPMVIASYLELILLGLIIYRSYEQLPNTINNQVEIISRHTKTREKFFNYINQTAKNLFSPNFLMVFVAYNLGMSQAGHIRFFTNIITLLYMLLNRSIGIPSGALFSHLKQSFAKTKSMFLTITNAYIQLLYVLSITIFVAIIPHISNQNITPHIIFFIATGFVEYITLTYEKLFIVQGSAKLLARINIFNILFLIIVLISKNLAPPFLIILPIFLIRLCSAIIIWTIAYHKWAIKPTVRIQGKTLITSCFFAGLAHLLIYVFYT